MEATTSNITVNVSGRRFEMSPYTYSRLVKNLPTSPIISAALGSEDLFFERHADAFQSILHYYQTGNLHLPLSVCPSLFKSELDFWGVEVTQLDKCCYNDYGTFEQDQTSLEKYERYTEKKTVIKHDTRVGKLQAKLWATLNYPFASTLAQVGY